MAVFDVNVDLEAMSSKVFEDAASLEAESSMLFEHLLRIDEVIDPIKEYVSGERSGRDMQLEDLDKALSLSKIHISRYYKNKGIRAPSYVSGSVSGALVWYIRGSDNLEYIEKIRSIIKKGSRLMDDEPVYIK